jgi:hypothetical protein
MGLDMWVHAVDKKAYVGEVDVQPAKKYAISDLQYWRKHNALHGWMESLYRSKGGAEEFNCVNLNLTVEDLDALESVITNKKLAVTEGFFFGADSSQDDFQREEDLQFINDARKALASGQKLFYSSWW